MTDIDKTVDEVFSSSLPYESWEQLKKESSKAFFAFCVFRDLGAERSIRKAAEASLESAGKDKSLVEKRYKSWCNWSTQWRWKERAVAYDRYLEQLKQAEIRKSIEAQGEKHREVAGKLLDVASRKLDVMNPEDLTQSGVTEFVTTGVKIQREATGLTIAKTDLKQSEFSFGPEFQGL